MSDLRHADVTSVDDHHPGGARDDLSVTSVPIDARDEKEVLEVVPDDAALFASPLPITGERKTTTRTELWNLLYLAGADPATGAACGDGAYGSTRSVNSIVLITNGISFALQAALFLIMGSMADYGSWRPHITTFFTLLAWGVSFGWLGVMDPSKWQAGTALYILGLIGYQGALTFWAAAFPGLARDLPEMQRSEVELKEGQIDTAEFDKRDMLARNRLANYRPGHRLPPHTSYLTAGVKQIYHAFRLCFRLKQTFIYLAAYFFLGDCLNTLVTVIATLQNEVASFDSKTLNYLLIDGIAAQAAGILICWLIQKHFVIRTKWMLVANGVFILILAAWGCVGITQSKFGFHNVWEFWLYQGALELIQGVFVANVQPTTEFSSVRGMLYRKP
ncbi:protein-vacuolar targeting-related protein [Trichosporon asahii var. asahii CBS 2479]|uniref:Autophagy-related protein n=1 Tax=Trichosporon asahii var. asahii (strain ATCC 90039 / CBS 2479 / JCM 2466 / KCTC 7840 / NBRC 103889/ NCYC 2677 / UAMH 7654) TaxID=1186058 RepID=J6EZM3_TRIAS|nr:protein-vacuolar targeting-related protein [Trichosporon asahii var. asahii CBS 2479]EJT50109.1 protein-vacuolar targeting-related protein [Trichosporon asahii var. asahii CBS 2479]